MVLINLPERFYSSRWSHTDAFSIRVDCFFDVSRQQLCTLKMIVTTFRSLDHRALYREDYLIRAFFDHTVACLLLVLLLSLFGLSKWDLFFHACFNLIFTLLCQAKWHILLCTYAYLIQLLQGLLRLCQRNGRSLWIDNFFTLFSLIRWPGFSISRFLWWRGRLRAFVRSILRAL